jgi:hypothetical protein
MVLRMDMASALSWIQLFGVTSFYFGPLASIIGLFWIFYSIVSLLKKAVLS